MLSRLLFVCLLCFAVPIVAQQDSTDSKLAARGELNQGVAAFRSANYDEAVAHFSNSVRLDPKLKVARLYLATAYAQQYVPGVETPENIQWANQALEQYAAVLRLDPKDVTSVKGIAYLHLQLNQFPEAKEDYEKAAGLDPADAENFYSIGVVDWTMVYRDMAHEQLKLKLDSIEKVVNSPRCSELRAKDLADIEDGMAMLTKAMALRPDYDDAMAYMNLLYRLHAGMDCGDKAMYAADMKAADKWSDSARAARRKNAEAAAKRTHDSATDGPR
jgi:tetratricopeptide (TPR) repeat protein